MGSAVYAESPGTLVLTGGLNAREITKLVEYCRRLHIAGQHDLRLDLSAVTSCDRPSLEGLTELRGGASGLTITIDGARWGQFILMLSLADVVELQELCDNVRALLRPAL
jgi:ABC-type transporter Mla MlaB component